MGPNYWDTDGATTKTKLQTAMEAALRTSADSCYSNSSDAYCYFGDFSCDADSSGDVICGGGSTNSAVNGDGNPRCGGDS